VVVVVIDLDGLKRINDRHGHLAGNRLLRDFAGLLGSVQGSAGSAYRWAGDEFAVLFRRTSLAEARTTMNAAVGMSTISFSWGASMATDRDATPHALVECTDDQMYEMKAKHKGRLRRLRTCIAGLMGGPRLQHDR
jgi:diguanylate cyclase (GGDEF)-like protein